MNHTHVLDGAAQTWAVHHTRVLDSAAQTLAVHHTRVLDSAARTLAGHRNHVANSSAQTLAGQAVCARLRCCASVLWLRYLPKRWAHAGGGPSRGCRPEAQP
jgi:hypothetical protein